MRKLSVVVIALIAIMMWGSVADAALMQFDDFIGECDCTIGGALRLRQEIYQNVYDLDSNAAGDTRDFFRLRANLWAKFAITDYDAVFLGLVSEPRAYLYPASLAAQDAVPRNYVMIDKLNFQLDEFMESPVSLKIGRQNLAGEYGEHFLISDGTPCDGSRTNYFDALKASVALTENETLDVLYIRNDKYDKKFLSDGAYKKQVNVNLYDEVGSVFYLKSNLSDELKAEAYWMNKVEKRSSTLKLNTLGAYAKYNAAERGTFRGQFAIQDGEQGNGSSKVDWSGWGGYLFWDKGFDGDLKPEVTIGGLFLSGDDPQTNNKIEGWNPLWSRFPYLNELYSYLLQTETAGVQGGSATGYWTNTALFTARLTITPMEKMSIAMAVDLIRAMEDSTAINSGDRTDKDKGLSPHITLKYKFSPTVSFRTQLYAFEPGDFYDEQDTAFFIRHEWNIKF
ncbi:MAG: alginate export family protein [Candidatus Omnitrophica bacterium]|nr:alginate export family protein [Candidatus Omnitrophota bacterium]